jgi:hypothetical protein
MRQSVSSKAKQSKAWANHGLGSFLSHLSGPILAKEETLTTLAAPAPVSAQGLTLVHFSAQLERFLWDRGCAYGLCCPCSGGVRGCLGCVEYFVCQTRLKLSSKGNDCKSLPTRRPPPRSSY